MNELNNRRPVGRPTGGAEMRGRPQGPEDRARAERLRTLQMGNGKAGRNAPPSEYSQIPLRPMTAMPREGQRPAERRAQAPAGQNVQRPHQRGPQRPPAQNQRPPIQRQRPPMQGQRPPMQGQRPPVQGQRPPVQGQRPPVQGQRPPVQGQRPPVKGQTSSARPPVNKRPPERKAPPERRQNGGWVIPEGSPVYTAEGRMYEGQMPPRRRPPESQRPPQRRPSPQDQRAGRAPSQGQRPRRNAPPPPPKKKKRFNKERFLFLVKTFFVRLLVMLIVVSLLGLWWYRAEFYSETEPRKGKVSFTLEGVGEYEAKASLAYRGEVLYCDFTEMAEWFGMVSVGSVNSMRFICTDGISDTSSGKGGEEYAIFTSGSTTVLINGVSVILEAPCRTVDSHIWIPLSFVENYVSGIVCDRGAKGTSIKLSPEGEQKEDKDEKIVIDAAFKVKAQNGLASVKYPE